ncbi:PAS domain S-box protein [Solitalea koreensis]|uniref:Sensory/regulatory protein RpfC n=1 Tax=Solitalea koreensis TaxID=543615 RepID=A0A521BL05_9SPHI|nr:PAS domain S-box protein [Solitalea koreensis]SMO47838.1 PAS domain S-box-containing protein [Solitalea koreensis]
MKTFKLFSFNIERKIAGVLVFLVLGFIIRLTIIYSGTKKIDKSAYWVEYNYESIKQVNEINSLIADSKNITREYLLLGDGSYKQRLLLVHQQLNNKIKQLQVRVHYDSVQLKAINTILFLVTKREKAQLQLFESYRSQESIKHFFDESALTKSQINDSFKTIIKQQNTLLLQSQIANKNERKQDTFGTFAAACVFFLLIIGLVVRINYSIIHKRRIEEQLLESEYKYRSLIENVGSVFHTTDREGNFTFTSGKATSLVGYTQQELLGMNYKELVDPEWIEKVACNYINQVENMLHETVVEFPIITKSGERKWVEQVSVFLSASKPGDGFLNVVKDITEKKNIQLNLEESEQKLKENQYLLQAIIDHSPSLVYVKDLEGRYLLINKSFRKLFDTLGIKHDILGKTDFDFFPIEEAVRIQKEDKMVFSTEQTLTFERDIVRDQTIHFLIVKAPLRNLEGDIFGVGGIATDITEIIQNRGELIEARKIAENASKMQEQFLANVSHEMRTPLNGILGMDRLLLETSLTEEQHEFASTIEKSSNNLLAIINDLLDFSKINAGKLVFERMDFDLFELLKNVQISFGHNLKNSTVDLKFNIDKTIPRVLVGDPFRLNQVLINLIGNAIKFTKEGRVEVDVTLKNSDDFTIILLIAVSDTGIGIPEKEIIHIFDPFIQAKNDISRKYGGSGLGLTICKQLLEMQGGEIFVSSKEGKGSVFSFALPLDIGRETVETLQNEETVNSAGIFEGKRFLLVEDNDINQKLVITLLQRVGALVVLAQTGKEAIHFIQSSDDHYDLILMDLQMPEMDGFSTALYIRKVLKLNTPIIAMTASALKGEKEKCLQFGMDDYLSKPFDFNVFYNKMAKRIGGDGIYVENAKKTQPDERIYSLSRLEELDDKEYLIGVINHYLQSIPVLLIQIKDGIQQSNWEIVYQTSHKAKSPVGLFQANTLLDKLHQIEINARNGADRDKCNQWIEEAIQIHAIMKDLLYVDLTRIENSV